MNEEWRDIPGYEGFYQASSQGKIRRIKSAQGTKQGRLLNPYQTPQGYLRVRFGKTRESQRPHLVHRVILTTFVSPPPHHNSQGNHLNGDKTDNRVENLEWLSPRENSQHAQDRLKGKIQIPKDRQWRVITQRETKMALYLFSLGLSLEEIEAKFDIRPEEIKPFLTPMDLYQIKGGE